MWADKGSRPAALRDQRRQSAYLFGAVCADRGVGAALVLPHANAKAMSLHLAEISGHVAKGAHAVVVLDGAGWHQTGDHSGTRPARSEFRFRLPITTSSRVLRRQFESTQYACTDYQDALAEAGIQPSMSRRGNALDNALMESFFHTLKTELVHHRAYPTHDEAKRDLFAYVKGWYNRQRLHSGLGYLTCPPLFPPLGARAC